MKNEAIYARQSLDKKDSLSIETQVEKCTTLCQTDNPLVYKDKGRSGKNLDREELTKLVEAIEADKISKVIVYKLDRISRNIIDFYNLYEIMKKHDCEFLSVSESFDTSNAVGRAMMGVLVVFAQMERENIQLRVKDNYYHRILDGRWAGGPAPFGYSNGKIDKKIPTLIPNEDEIQAIPIIFGLYANSPNISLGKVAKKLSELGYVSRKRETFDTVTVARILQNPVYAVADKKLYKYYQIQKIKFLNDEEQWNGEHSACIVGKKVGNVNVHKYTDMKEQSIYLTNIKGIVDSRTFIRVQQRLKENQQIASANKSTVLKELAGKLKCKECGYAIKSYSKSTNGMPYLSCYGARTLHTCDVTFKGLKFDEIRKTVAEEIQTAINGLEKVVREKNDKNNSIRKQMKSLSNEIDILIEAMTKSEKLEDKLLLKIEEKETQLHELELKLSLDVDVLDNIEIYSSLRDNVFAPKIQFDELSDDSKKAIVNQLIDKINIDKDNNIEIIWKI